MSKRSSGNSEGMANLQPRRRLQSHVAQPQRIGDGSSCRISTRWNPYLMVNPRPRHSLLITLHYG